LFSHGGDGRLKIILSGCGYYNDMAPELLSRHPSGSFKFPVFRIGIGEDGNGCDAPSSVFFWMLADEPIAVGHLHHFRARRRPYRGWAALSAALNVPENELRLREQATEHAVKSTPLADYRIMYFATHGLVSGEVNGVAEPALVLSLPG
jgi:hypothetical protein